MKNFVKILAAVVVMTTGAYAQGLLSADEGTPTPKQRSIRAHPTADAQDVVSSDGSIAPNPIIAKPGPAWQTPLPLPGQAVVQRLVALNDAAWEAENAVQEDASGAVIDDNSLLEFPSFLSAQPRFNPSNFRAWDYYTDGSWMIADGSSGALASVQALSRQNQIDANTGGSSGGAINSAAKADASPQQDDLELIDENGPHRLIIANIASPEPNTIALAVIGGAAFGWSRLSRRRTIRPGGN